MSVEEISDDINSYDYTMLVVPELVLDYYNEVLSRSEVFSDQDTLRFEQIRERLQKMRKEGKLFLDFKEIDQLHKAVNKIRKTDGESEIYMYDLMRGVELKLPEPRPIVRSAALQTRLDKLRIQVENQQYQNMTANLTGKQFAGEGLSLKKELKVLDSQMMMLFNSFLTVLAAFAFGYKAIEYAFTQPSFELQLTVGVILATIVFFADVFLIVRSFEREDERMNSDENNKKNKLERTETLHKRSTIKTPS